MYRYNLKSKNSLSISGFLVIIFLALSSLVFNSFFIGIANAAAGVPKIINFQGRLLNSSGDLLGGPSGTDYCYKFSLYDDPTTGAKVWPADAPSTMTIVTREGVFNGSIGNVAAGGDTLDYDFQTDDDIYIDIQVATKVGASCTTGGDESFESLTPRSRVVSAGYAINSGTVGGFTPAQSATDNQIPVLTSGALVFGHATAAGIKAAGSNVLTFQSGVTGDIQFFSSSNKITSAGALTTAGLFTSNGGISIGAQALTGTTGIIDYTGFDIDASGNLDALGTITAGSSNTAVTLATGKIDADALTLTVAADGGTGTSAGSGLIARSDGIGLLQGCSDGQILKWVESTDTWDCAADTSGGSTWDTIGDAAGNGGIAMAETVQTLDWNANDVTALAVDGLTLTYTNDAATDVLAQNLLVLANVDASGSSATEALLVLDNRDTTEAVSDAIRITSAAGGITTGLDFDDTDIVTDIELQNDETIDNNVNGTIQLTAGITALSGDLTVTGGDILLGTTSIFSGGDTASLNNIDAIDATTETTFESAIDTLANLVSVQGQTFTLAGALITSGANSLTLTTTGTTNVTLPTSGTLATLTGTETFSGKTFTAPKFADLGFIADSSGNESLIFDSVASAFNEITIVNSAIGNGVALKASGGDTDVAISFDAKGAGAINIGNTSTGSILFAGGSGSTGCTITTAGAFACSGAVTGSNLSGTNTGDQTSVTGNAGTVTFADAASDTTTFVALGTDATGSLAPATDAGLSYNASTNALTTTTFIGALTGNVTGNVSGTAATVTSAAQSSITSLGTLTTLTIDDITINGNTLSSAGASSLAITPLAGQAILLDGTISIDAGVLTGATSISSTAFVGALTGNASTATALQNARTIGGVSFDGTGNITVASATGAFAVTGALAANGGITFDGAGDTVGAHTMGGNVVGGSFIITDIGNTGTDFVASTGALTLAGVLTANGGVSMGTQALTGSTGIIDYTGFDIDASGNLDALGTITAGSGNIAITVAAGTINASTALTLTSADGAGGTSNGSGLEVGNTSAIGLLQGCADGQILKWVDASNVWNCAADASGGGGSLQGAYDGGTPTILTDASGDIIFQTIGGATDTQFEINAASAPEVDMVNLTNAGFGTTVSGVDGLSINFVTGDGANVINSALDITITNGGTASGDITRGLTFNNVTPTAATETGIYIGTGYDNDIQFNDTTPTITLGATDNTAIFKIVDSNATPNTLLRIEDHATNFGASVEAGAFIDLNSYYSEEFFKDRAQIIAAGNQTWGDNTEWSPGETGTCLWDGQPDTSSLNGATLITANAAASSCMLRHADLAAATANTWMDVDNLPTLLMKVRPSVGSTGVPDTDHQFFAGMSDLSSATPASGAPTNGVYFTNASDANGVTGTANWYAVTKNGAGTATVTACSVAVSETQYALLMIKVMANNKIRFYIDGDVSNGVSFTQCGGDISTNINTAGMTSLLKADWDANTNTSLLEVDFYRVWQDDATPSPSGEQEQPLVVEASPSVFDGRQALVDLAIANENIQYNPASKLETQVLHASKGIVTPELYTSSISTDIIRSSTGKDIGLLLDADSKFTIGEKTTNVIINADGTTSTTTTSSTPIITFDSHGNAFFAGKVTAGSIEVGEIKGLSIFTDQLSYLSEQVSGTTDQTEGALSVLYSNVKTEIEKLNSGALSSESIIESLGTTTSSLVEKMDVLQLWKTSLGNMASSSDGLIISSGVVVQGGLSINEIRSSGDLLSIMNDVEFFGTPYFTKDTAGFAVIYKNATSTDVVFDREYLVDPIVNTTITIGNDESLGETILESNVRFIVTKKTKTGFTIKLASPAPADITFSWTSFAVKDPRTFFSPITEAVNVPDPTPTTEPEPEPEPTPEPIVPTPVEVISEPDVVLPPEDNEPVVEIPEPEPEPEPTPVETTPEPVSVETSE